MAVVETGLWRIRETRGGKGNLHNITNRGLTIGRRADADIIVHSRTVDQHHACIQWDSLNKCFSIRDLESVNGTFVNKKLLRGESHLLEDGDSLRFGYDTQQIFRVEQVVPPLPVLQPTTAASTQTSLQQDVTPPQSPPTTQPLVPHPHSHYQAPPPQPLVPHPHPHYQYISAAQPTAVMVSPSIMVPQMVSYGLSPASNQYVAVSGMPTAQMVSVTPTCQLALATPTSGPNPVALTLQPAPVTPTSQLAKATPTIQPVLTTPTFQASSSSGGAGTVSNGKKAVIRLDGRRPIPKEDLPSLSKASSLFGQPHWWGEDEDFSYCGGLSDSELSPLQRSGRILRDLDTCKSEDEGGRNKQVRRRVLQESSPSSSSLENIRKETGRTATSFTVAFEAPKRAKPARLCGQRPLSAPHLSTQRNMPWAETKGASSEALVAARKPPSGVKRRFLRCKMAHTKGSPLVLNQAHTVIPLSGQGPLSSGSACKHSASPNISYGVSSNFTQEGFGSSPTSAGHLPMGTTSSPTHIDHLPPEMTPNSTNKDHLPSEMTPTHVDHLPPEMTPNFTHTDHLPPETIPKPTQASLPLQSLSESALGGWRSVSQPGSHHGTPHNWDSAVSESGSRPGSARKQWRDGLSEVPYGLMLAAVAARTKSVAESAQKTAEFIHTLMSSVQGGGLAASSMAVSDSLSNSLSLKLPCSGLPQWSFVNKDFTDIFKNLRIIEKSLKEMTEPLVITREEVDYLAEEDPSDGEMLVCDDVEDQLATEADDESEG